MYRIFLLLCLILHPFVCKADEDIISDYSNSLSSLEGDPNSIIYNCVNVITGDYIDMETDIELPGVESMNLRRFYCSSNNSEHWFRSWHFNHDMSIRKNKNGNPKGRYVDLHDAFGACFRFSGMKYKSNTGGFCIKVEDHYLEKGVTNTPKGLSGRHHIKNKNIFYGKEETFVKEGSGAHYYFGKVGRGHYPTCLKKAVHPNRTQFSYTYDGSHNPRFDTIQSENWQGKALNQLKFEWKEINRQSDEVALLAYHRGKQLAQLEYKQIRCYPYVKEDKCEHIQKNRWLLTKASYTQRPNLVYHYTFSTDKKLPQPPLLVRKELPEGRTLEIDYFKKGVNWVWPGQSCEIDRARQEMVMQLRAPVGTDATPLPIYRFLYDRVARRTEVYDAQDHRKVYHYNEQDRLNKIESFTGNAPFYKYAEERFTWGVPCTKDCGNLLTKTLVAKDGFIFFNRTYTYDSAGNVLEEVLYGNLTGRRQEHVAVDDQDKGINNGADRLFIGRAYTTDGLNLLRYENNPNSPHDILYEYFEGTELMSGRFVVEGDQIRIRKFFDYDENGAMTLEIEDNGSTLDRNNLLGVTERHIRQIRNTSSFPIGLPEEVTESCLDLTSGQTRLLNRITHQYDENGRLVAEAHYNSDNQYLYALTWAYNNYGQVTEERNALGHVVRKAYDANGNLKEEHGPRPNTSRLFHYDYMNRLVREEMHGDDLHLVKTYRYDTLNNKIGETDIHGHETKYTYDEFGRIIAITQPAIRNEHGEWAEPITRKEYDALGHVMATTDPCGHRTTSWYTLRGQPTNIKHPDGTEELFEYTLKGQPYRAKAPNGTSVVYHHDYLGRTLKRETYSPAGALLATESFIHDAFHLISETDAEGMATSYTYDGAGRLICQRSGSKRTEHIYNAEGFVQETRSFSDEAHFLATHYRYDAVGQVIEETVKDEDGALYSRHSYLYDEEGNCLEHKALQDHRTAVTTTTFNLMNEPIKVIDPLGRVTIYRYNYGSSPSKETIDPAGCSVITHFDPLGRQSEQLWKDPFGSICKRTLYEYDLNGACVRIVEGLNEPITARFEYDSMHRLTFSCEACGTAEQKATRRSYNAYGQLETITKADGIQLKHTYDAFGQLQSFAASDASFQYAYTYDRTGHLLSAADLIHHTSTQRTYDQLGRMIQEIQANGLPLHYEYDNLDRCICIKLPDETNICYNYSGPHLHSIERKSLLDVLYKQEYESYNYLGQSTRIHLPYQAGRLENTFELDGALEARSTPHWKENILKRDPSGHLTARRIQDSIGAFDCAYSYDSLYQLTAEQGLFEHCYINNEMYNQTSKDGTLQTFNALNQILQSPQATYSYDSIGNRLAAQSSDGTVKYAYDALDRLISVTTDDAHTVYTYDAFNRRLTKASGNQLQQFFYINGEEAGACDALHAVTELRVPGGGRGAIALELYGEHYVPVHDHLGHICALLDPSGEVVETYRYSVFGEERIYDAQNQLKTEALSPWRYAGKRHDAESGFIYFGLRYYDPLSNVWLTPDPIGREGGPNLYAYVLNNPLSFFDRFGLNPEEDVDTTTQTVKSSGEAVSSNESVNSNGSSKDSAIDRDRREQNRPPSAWQRVKEFTSAVAHSFWSPEDHILDRDDDLRQTGIDAFNGNYANIAERWNQMDSLSRVRFTGNCVGLACSLFPVARAASGFKYGVKYCQKTYNIGKRVLQSQSAAKKTQQAATIKKQINSNPFKGNVSRDIMIVDSKGNVIPVKPGQHLTGSSDGKWIQVRDSLGNPTGLRKDGPHSLRTHNDLRALRPHAHVPEINNRDGTPWLPIKH